MQLKQYAVDETYAEEGRVIPLGQDSFVKIAKFGNKRFNKEFNKLTAPYGKRVDRIDPEEKEAIYLTCFCAYIVLDWGGIFDGEELIEYSPANVEAMLKKYPEFHGELIEMSRDYAIFVADNTAEDLGNSQPPSEQS